MAKKGGEDSFEKTVLSNITFLRNTAFKLTRHIEDGEDLLQETLMRAYRFFDKYEPGTHPKAWLYRIMKNTFINSYRKSKREPQTSGEENIESFPGVRSALDPQRALSNKNLYEKMGSALSKLPPDFKETLILSLVEGYSYKEVAEIMACPIGTIMSRIHRARKLVQKELAKFEEEIGDSGCFTGSFSSEAEMEANVI